MKHKGSNFEFEEELCIELFETFRRVFRAQGAKVYEDVVNQPASRFWVTPIRATIVIQEMIKGNNDSVMRTTKKDMYKEIYNRVMDIIQQGDERTIYQIVEDVVEHEAPRFFVTPKKAREKIIKGRKLWRQKHPLFVPNKSLR